MRIAYWTTAPLAPEIEAVSKEVYDLARAFPSFIFASSPHLGFAIRLRQRAIGVNSRLSFALRHALPAIEAGFSLNHIYAEVNPWVFLSVLGRRPTMMTIASEKGSPDPDALDRCRAIVVQTEGMHARLRDAGVDGNRTHLIYPGIDIDKFVPRNAPCAHRNPRILFATFPRSDDELEARGVLLLLDAARRSPDVEFHLLTRPWGSGNTALDVVQRRTHDLGLRNITLIAGAQPDMERLYPEYDFTVIPYTRPDGGKECPRSLLESLACGVPVLISDAAPLAPLIAGRTCGSTFRCNSESLLETLESSLRTRQIMSAAARRAASDLFDRRETVRRYGELYAAVGRAASLGAWRR